MKSWIGSALLFALASAALPAFSSAQAPRTGSDWEALVRTPSVSGHEGPLATQIVSRLESYSPTRDNLGNVLVTIGSGSPHRLFIAPIDEPGYVVSGITSDGFLRVQRLPQRPPNDVFDALHFAQPVVIRTRSGKSVSGVFAGLSVHLMPLRPNPPKMNHPDDLYLDIGATSPDEVRAAGVDLLDPVSLLHDDYPLANQEFTAPGIGDHFGAVVLVKVLEWLRDAKPSLSGTLTFAFVTEQWAGGRGLERVLVETHPDELIYVGRIHPAKDAPEKAAGAPGDGALLATSSADASARELAQQLKELAKSRNLPFRELSADAPRIAGYVAATPFPPRMVQLGLPLLLPSTPAETLSASDLANIQSLLFTYLTGKPAPTGSIASTLSGCADCRTPLIGSLTASYGASGHEEAVREEIKRQLPEWARKLATTDAAGNLVLPLGGPNAKSPRIAFVAHMDELGYVVKTIADDGRLQVDVVGGGYPQYFLGHAALLHLGMGKMLGGVLELPAGWEKPGFEMPTNPRSMDEPAFLYVGAHSRAEAEQLGIKPGQFVTIPKAYRPLLDKRANARSFDDRVGCAALIEAVRALGPGFRDRDITFVWSTREEIGLEGAAAFAEQAAKDARVPDFVFAIDTFVSSDSPLESKRFADAAIGKGFVVRAVDNSNIAPLDNVNRLVSLAKRAQIPVQFGVTGGGNDGAVFLRYGSVDIPLGWPLRYSHSPGEVIDTRDLDALSAIVTLLAREW